MVLAEIPMLLEIHTVNQILAERSGVDYQCLKCAIVFFISLILSTQPFDVFLNLTLSSGLSCVKLSLSIVVKYSYVTKALVLLN